eukprot:TRINITY_DN33489_c0_g1_i1.p1 TRINITY_DN33489_c0_g1~~TRINITY_DN33489_c0_g1_i1.p1  ORF type:complete len:280 (-),score=47.61 TRINITY_DN33489_c0_g1_i1:287-1054(-)
MLKVLFVHGLESGPRGSKAKYLASLPGVQTVTPDLHMSLVDCRKKNSVIRCIPAGILRTPLGMLVVLCSMPLLLFWASPWKYCVCALCAGLTLWLGAREALQISMERCIQIVGPEISKFQPHVVVGSSWGGAVALQCAACGMVKDAALLLVAPATCAAGSWSLLWPDTSDMQLPLGIADRCLVVHGDQDNTVPVEGSRKLCKANGIRLIEIGGGDHRLNEGIVRTGRLEELIREMGEGTEGLKSSQTWGYTGSRG